MARFNWMNIYAGEPVMFVHFVVFFCLLIMKDENVFKKSPLKLVGSLFVCLLREIYWQVPFFCKSCITNRDQSARHKSKKENWDVG